MKAVGRPRSPGKSKLPPGLYERRGYWTWRDKTTGKEWGLGRIARHDAISQVLEVHAHPARAVQRFPAGGVIKELAVLSHDEIVALAAAVAHQCGVYFLVQDGRVMYVGQSINVGRRISEHLNAEGRTFESYHFIKVARELLDDTEAAYIHALQPPWNFSIPTKK